MSSLTRSTLVALTLGAGLSLSGGASAGGALETRHNATDFAAEIAMPAQRSMRMEHGQAGRAGPESVPMKRTPADSGLPIETRFNAVDLTREHEAARMGHPTPGPTW